MTQLLEQAFAKASELNEAEQNALARWILEELESEHRWEELFANSQDELASLAKEALDEHHKGKTKPLDPESL
jgi:hypothetical protein